MSKRSASRELPETLLSPVPKKAKLEGLPPANSPKSLKRVAHDACQDLQSESSHRASKKAKMDDCATDSADSSEGDLFERTQSPQPQPEEDPAVIAYCLERAQQIEDQRRRAQAHVHQYTQAYAVSRLNRLPSPTLSDRGSDAGRSDLDENGYSPQMFDLADDDPKVETIFGPEHAARFKARGSVSEVQSNDHQPSQQPHFFMPDGRVKDHITENFDGPETSGGSASPQRCLDHRQTGRLRKRASYRQARSPTVQSCRRSSRLARAIKSPSDTAGL
ncbi:hypothetical protein VM1G_06593 [Cytospora mali]|uniref:Uncharacterized protein n=1 Tax=Cytospora mali TaxID=578113 RepID=A0A194W5J5_CYTMA|nr:hypothetical protein VM1G_06593 [Valsa mali]